MEQSFKPHSRRCLFHKFPPGKIYDIKMPILFRWWTVDDLWAPPNAQEWRGLRSWKWPAVLSSDFISKHLIYVYFSCFFVVVAYSLIGMCIFITFDLNIDESVLIWFSYYDLLALLFTQCHLGHESHRSQYKRQRFEIKIFHFIEKLARILYSREGVRYTGSGSGGRI